MVERAVVSWRTFSLDHLANDELRDDSGGSVHENLEALMALALGFAILGRVVPYKFLYPFGLNPWKPKER